MTESASAAEPYPIRPVGADEFDSFHLVDQHAFHGGPLTEDDRRVFLPRMEFDRSLAAFDEGTVISAAGAYSFMLSVPGGEVVPAAGVSLVAVLPTYRRRGVLTSMMRRQLDDVRDRGEPLAVLWASEAPIYSRYGYGRASWLLTYSIKRGEGAMARPVDPDVRPRLVDPEVRLRLVEPADAQPEMAKVYEEVMASRPGMFARNEGWWRRMVYDPAADRNGAGPLRCLLAEHRGRPRGYALYSAVDRWDERTFLPDGVLTVRELMSSMPEADAALWGDLLSRDLTGEFRASRRPVDDPVLYQLADPRRVRPLLSDALWVRITDVPAALARRAYAGPVDVVIEVRDSLIRSNAGAWRLTVGGAGDAASCVPAGGSDSDVQLAVSALGAAYLGGTRLGALAGAGLVTGRPDAIRQLSTAMSWDPAPWCPIIF
jgi:predicted acetyltransferase